MTTNLAADTLDRRIGEMHRASIAEKEVVAREIIAKTGVFAPEKLARIQYVLPLTRRNGGNVGVDDIRLAIRGVLEEFGREDLKVAPEVEADLAAACCTAGYADVRNIKRTVQSLLEGALLNNDAGAYEVWDNTICGRVLF